MKMIKQFIFWLILLCAQFLTICLLAWHLLVQIDFAYPFGYRLLHLERNIAEFAPKNYYRHGFEYTTSQEHWNLFSSICYSIQHGGKNLADIAYVTPGGTVVPLMHQAEITHLQDVSNLVDFFYKAGLLAAIVWLIFFAIAFKWRLDSPSLRRIFVGFLACTALMGGVIFLMGPTEVFYWFHVKVFPEGHQWFFYYQESLMTTLMKAPDIFAFIALLLLCLLGVLWSASTYGMAFLLRQRSGSATPAAADGLVGAGRVVSGRLPKKKAF
ncbi:MAG: DUF1461 domain-containing protein [Polaromonas sp.]|nr:DUF1461 domain-containing protein [Polaromonas sp.]